MTKQLVRFVFCAAVSALAVAPGQSGPEEVRLSLGKSVVIDYPTDVARISTSNADIVDASPVTTREILLHGKSLGTVTLVVWSKTGQRNFYNVTVDQNLEPLRRLLRETFPKDEFTVFTSRDSIALNGRVASKEVAERAMALSASFGKTVVNNLQVAPGPIEKQILLRVKFAELDRTASAQFGVNLLSTGATNTVGSVNAGVTGGTVTTATPGVGGAPGTAPTLSISQALNIFAFRPDLNLGVLIQALESKSLVQILAEPNLITSNNTEASFVVGGEFPVPVLQGGANSGAVTVQFREFGVRLSFTPVITENKTIRIHVKPEVSDLDYSHAVTLNGFTIPALASKKMETTIELGEGQSFVIAGLLDNRVTDSWSKIPGIGSIPIIGELFKTRSLNRTNSELIIMVTPEFTLPLAPSDTKPSIAMPSQFLLQDDKPKSGSHKKAS
jgi:pilus assembly protein CpaC